MIRSIIIGILTVGLVGISYWGYKEHEEKNALLLHAENNYQRSFHELTYRMDSLHDKIGTSLAMNSPERISPHFVDIWRLSTAASTNASQLPLSLIPVIKTKEFLSSISDFTYKTAVRNLNDDPLTDKEIETLEHYYEQAAIIKDELRRAQHLALENNLRWMDVELALVTNDEQTENVIIDGLKSIENTVSEFSDGEVGSELMKTDEDKHTFKHLQGEQKDEQQILSFAKDIFQIEDEASIKITKSGPGSRVPNYNVSYVTKDKNIYMDITEQGAHPINILINREIGEQRLSVNDGLIEAENYLKTFDYKDMKPVETTQFDNVGIYKFLYTVDNIRVYPDMLTVKVGLDEGDIIGLNAREYLKNHHARKIPDAKISTEEAKQFVNKGVNIQEEHMAIIENSLGEEVLTYEFLGTLRDDTYRIFINAENGYEEKVEKLTGTETNFQVNS